MAFLLVPADSSLVCRSLVGPRGARASDSGWPAVGSGSVPHPQEALRTGLCMTV